MMLSPVSSQMSTRKAKCLLVFMGKSRLRLALWPASCCSFSRSLGEPLVIIGAVRFWHRVDTMMAQGQGLLRTFRKLPESTIFRRPTLGFVVAGMRRRTEAVMPYAELAAGAASRLLGHFRRRKTLAVATGVVGLALFFILLLEISLRIQLAQEAR